MNIEDAKFILSNVEITEPSVRSLVYFEKDEINEAIENVVDYLDNQEVKIKELEASLNELMIEINNLNLEKQENSKIFAKIKNTIIGLNAMTGKRCGMNLLTEM